MPRHPDSRERLLATAAELILANGYNATSVDKICEACGIKKGSFYHHFSSKEELAGEALARDWENFKRMLDEAFSPSRAPLERIRAFCRGSQLHQGALQSKCGFVCGCPLFSLGTEIGTHEPKLRQNVEDHLTLMAKYFESALREAHALGEAHVPDPKQTSWTLLTFIEGALTLGRIRNDLQPVRQMEDAILRLIGARSEQLAST